MNFFSADDRIVVSTKHRAECSAAHLVLRSAGIAAQVKRDGGDWLVIVGDADHAASIAELKAYSEENVPVVVLGKPSGEYGGALLGFAIYAIYLIAVALLDFQSLYEISWRSVGSSHADKVVAGELWRVFTALTLHADVEHLAGNLVFGALFGFGAARVLGGGVAWLAIVLAGGLGNWINAMVQLPEHTSIGASTAVFAALGVSVAHALRHRSVDDGNRLKRWSPLIAGVVLFGFTGIGGERTDVLAHVTGFLAGLIAGWIGSSLSAKTLSSARMQAVCAIVAGATIAAAWIIGVIKFV